MKTLGIIAMTLLIIFPLKTFSQETMKKVNLYSTKISTKTIEKYRTSDPTIPVYQKVKHNYTYRVNEEDITLVSKKSMSRVGISTKPI